MKKSILLFATIALTFVACEQPNTENVDYKNPDVYGVWAQDYVDKAGENTTSILYINDRNIEFISEDSLISFFALASLCQQHHKRIFLLSCSNTVILYNRWES